MGGGGGGGGGPARALRRRGKRGSADTMVCIYYPGCLAQEFGEDPVFFFSFFPFFFPSSVLSRRGGRGFRAREKREEREYVDGENKRDESDGMIGERDGV